jgi:hypothetical protein
MGAKIDLTGKRMPGTRLTVIKEAGRDAYGQALWECRCDCGNTCVVRGYDLRSGNTKSCGCYNAELYEKRIKKQTVDHSNPSRMKSKKLSSNNTSGVRGVCPTKQGKWRAVIGVKGKLLYLGEYAKIEDAIIARKEAEEKYWKPILEKA